MQTKVYSDNMALWCFTGLCSTPGFLSVYSVLCCTSLKKKITGLANWTTWNGFSNLKMFPGMWISQTPQNTDTPDCMFHPVPTPVSHSLSHSLQPTISSQPKEQNSKNQPAKSHTKAAQAAPTTYLWSRLPLPAPFTPHAAPPCPSALVSLPQPHLWGYHSCGQQLTSC